MTTNSKEININLRVRKDVREDFKIVADLRGASMSSLIHQFMVECIREEKERSPEAFSNLQYPNAVYRQEAIFDEDK
jgi:antitoxin component of RelBE/YafQ-DinJ toxin-antitoxin module